jgi:signal transduction histidine kinase
MTSVPPAAGRPRPHVAAAAAAMLVVCTAARADAGAAAAWWPVAAGLGLGLAAGAAALWVARGHLRDRAEIRGLRERETCLAEMSSDWQWRSDAAHRLVALRPPAGAPHADWTLAAPGACVWEVFAAADGAALKRCLEARAGVVDLAVTLGPADAPRVCTLRARPLADETGAFAGHVGVLAELPAPAPVAAPAADEATAPNEHESFSYTVSHDLRAPIRVVEGFTRIVKEDYGRHLDRLGNDHLDRVLAAAARMNGMIDALLALSRLSSQTLARQPVNLSQLASFVAEDLRRHSPGREVALTVEPDLAVVGDPTLLRTVVENLIGNAWKYTGKTAQAQVWFGRDPARPHTYLVRDNGAGFDMRFADRLFGVFQRLHSASDFAGTGVGLASVRRIVRRHGGEIWAEAEVGKGASFHFSLPPPGG